MRPYSIYICQSRIIKIFPFITASIPIPQFPRSQWTPGQRLKDGKYTIEELLGFGGFGVTYRAREQSSGQFVAIKTLNPLQQSKPDFAAIQKKFVQEAFRLVKCSHPNIVQVHKKALGGDQNLLAIRGYKLVRKLGEGGFGEVYLALNQQNGEMVALKVMLPKIAANQRAIDKFLREMANTKALNHPHVVKLRDYRYSDHTFLFTLEYGEGGSVADLMQL